jgi:hypothetical protein
MEGRIERITTVTTVRIDGVTGYRLGYNGPGIINFSQ